jgi:CubicO group peptidase (beta-lactamase class C family)
VGSTRKGSPLRLTLFVLGFLAAAVATPAPSFAATPGQIARLDALFRTAYPPSGPGAAVLVVQDGRPVLREGYGLANVELSVPIRPEMVFRIGSTTKQFTSACILKLVEQRRLRLDDPISKSFPDYPAPAGGVTIEQLLTHTSGIQSATEMPAWFPHMREDWTVDQVIGVFRNEPLEFAPGSRWHYTNSGYMLLGAILEKVTGRPYADVVADWIFRPLGMKDTRYDSEAPILPGRANGYRKTPDGVINAPYLSMTQPFAAGGLVSTVDDLARWQSALDRGEILSAESRRRMWTPVVLPDGRSTRYGYGWAVWSYEGHAVVEHGGSINGFSTANMRLPDDRIYVAVLSNCGGCADPRALALTAATTLLGAPFDRRKAAEVSESVLDRYAGSYRDEDGDVWAVSREGDHLSVAAGRPYAAYPMSESAFFFRDAVRTLRFVSDASGRVVAMEIDEGIGPVARAPRVP